MMAFVQIHAAFPWDGDDTWRIVRDGVEHAVNVYEGWDQGGDTPGKGFALPSLDDERARKAVPVGSAAEVAHALRPFAEAFGGRRDFTLVMRMHFPGLDYETTSHAVELFGEHVIPALKGS